MNEQNPMKLSIEKNDGGYKIKLDDKELRYVENYNIDVIQGPGLKKQDLHWKCWFRIWIRKVMRGGVEEMEATIMKMLSVTALCACLKGAMPDHNRNVEFIYIVVMLMILINYVRSLISF